jgi:hypothetical protein
MTQFLQFSVKLSTCYACIGVAPSSMLRIGLHRSFNADFTLIQSETRMRAFWATPRMHIHVVAMLELPYFLQDKDIV